MPEFLNIVTIILTCFVAPVLVYLFTKVVLNPFISKKIKIKIVEKIHFYTDCIFNPGLDKDKCLEAHDELRSLAAEFISVSENHKLQKTKRIKKIKRYIVI